MQAISQRVARVVEIGTSTPTTPSEHNNNIGRFIATLCAISCRITKTSVPENSLSKPFIASSRVDREKTAITRCHNKDAPPADNTMINTRRYLESAGLARPEEARGFGRKRLKARVRRAE